MTHGAVASQHLGTETVAIVLSDDWRRAPVDDTTLAGLEYLETLTARPQALDIESIRGWLARGNTLSGLEVLTLVCFCFSVMNRMVDAFGADITEAQVAEAQRRLGFANKLTRAFRKPKPRRPAAGGALPAPFVALVSAIRDGPGDLPAELRHSVEAQASAHVSPRPPVTLPDGFAALVDAIAVAPHDVTDEMLDRLKPNYSEQAIYELVFVAAAASGISRLERAWPLLAQAT